MNAQINILVIEDDNELRETLRKVLNKEGYSSVGAKDSKEALKLAKENQYDLVVADVRLPGVLDGVEVVKKMKEMSSNKIKSVIITGYTDAVAPVNAIKIKVDDFLWKPFEINEFLFSVKDTLKEIQQEKNDKEFAKGTAGRIIAIIADQLCVKLEEIKLTSIIKEELGSDSLDTAEILIALEEEFKIPLENVNLETIITVQDIINCVEEKKGKNNA